MSTFLNEVDTDKIGLGITRLLVAPSGTSWTPGRITIASPPANFFDLGAVVDDSPVLRVSREKFKLITGIPRVIQYQAILAMEGMFECMLHSNSWEEFEYALGNTIPDTTNWATTPDSSDYVIQYYGTSVIKEYVLLGVTDFTNGDQVVHHIPRGTPADEVSEEYRPDQEGRVPINMELLAQAMDVGLTNDELVLAVRYQFGKLA